MTNFQRKVALRVDTWASEVKSITPGLPQGSALSPILFRIFIMDLATELSNRGDISIMKFADDGTIRVTSNSTPQCLETLQYTLSTVNSWTKKWRMVINCQPNKTEIIGFSTAERDKSLIPATFKLGDSTINRVSQTKALGLVIDEDLNFTEHSNTVYKKLLGLWAMISRYSNRHWGFNVNTMTIIIKTLFLPTLLYAGHIWINHRNMKEINSLYYKILKSTVGAVFNIRQSYAEIILGLPPIKVVTEINKVKHNLKIHMAQIPEDRLRDLVEIELRSNQGSAAYHSIRQVFKYLKWKLQKYPESIADRDKDIIYSGNIEEFFNISTESCKYTKAIIVNYTEYLWKNAIQNELQQEGHSVIPEPKCTPVPFTPGLKRDEEVMIMNLMYPNNTLNSFLHSFNSEKFHSPMCSCGDSVQTAHHVLFTCSHVDEPLRLEAYRELQQVVGEADAAMESELVILKASKSTKFLQKTCEIMKIQAIHMTTHIEL